MTRAELVAQLAALDAADAKAAAEAAAKANVEALKSTVVSSVAGSGGIGARQDQYALARAQAYIPSEPTAAEVPYGPLRWAYPQFLAAGLTEPSAPNGATDRMSGEGAVATQPETWVPAFKAVLAHYQAGTDMIEADHAARVAADKANAGNENIPGIGYPILNPATINAVLAAFDANSTNPEVQWNQALRGGSTRGITNAEYVALQNRGYSVATISANLQKYNA